MKSLPAFLVLLGALVTTARAAEIDADPTNYRSLLGTLQPGDTLLLAGGDYEDLLPLSDRNGTADNWIVIRGPATGTPARFLGDTSICCNTVEISRCSYLALENLTIDGQGIDGIFAISAGSGPTHHIRIQGCTIVGHGAHQQTVGISSKVTTWGWIIRGNTIVGAGTGIYLGNSDGTLPFIGGLIENNLFRDSRGYNMEIKHQTSRPAIEGIPTTPQRTIIRHNVFIKGVLPNDDGARPALLVGTFPDTGNGSEDMYEIYGNFFYGSKDDAQLQATGRVSIHDNVFVNGGSDNAITLVDHNGPLKVAYVYNNTIYAADNAIAVWNAPDDDHEIVGNVMFANAGIVGSVTNQSDNVFDSVANAGNYVKNPSTVMGSMDFYPLAGQLEGAALDLGKFTAQTDYDVDFNGTSKGTHTFRGAYAGSGTNPGWQLQDALKDTEGTSLPPEDGTPPAGSIQIDGGAATTDTVLVTLGCSATDDGSGMGAGAQMRFSNDGVAWSPAEAFATTRADWDLSAYGGSATAGLKTVHVRYRDVAGNWSTADITASIELQVDGPAPEPAPAPSGGGCSVAPGTHPRGPLAPFVFLLALALLGRRLLVS